MSSSSDTGLNFISDLMINAVYTLLNYAVDHPGGDAEQEAHYELTVQEIKRTTISYLMSIAEIAD